MYTFPTIRTIDDVKPYFDSNFFVKKRQNGLVYFNYRFQSPETFPDDTSLSSAIRREFRGLCFDEQSGKVVSRPFHKFFNKGEKSTEPQGDFAYLEKLDGSMVRPVPVEGGIRWATKAGISDVSMKAEQFVARSLLYNDFAAVMFYCGLTPIFEFVSPDNRIVLPYDEPNMVLLAVRRNESGEYANYESLDDLAGPFDIPIVQQRTVKYPELLEHERDCEGVVLLYEDGHMLKQKNRWYVNLHKVKEITDKESNLIEHILDDNMDDLYGILEDDDKEKVEDFHNKYVKRLNQLCEFFDRAIENRIDLFETKSQYAKATKDKSDNTERKLILKIWSKRPTSTEEVLKDYIKNNLKGAKYEPLREYLYLPEWRL